MEKAMREKDDDCRRSCWLPNLLAANGYECELFGSVFSDPENCNGKITSQAKSWISMQCENGIKPPFCAIISLSDQSANAEKDTLGQAQDILASLRQFSEVHRNTIILLTCDCSSIHDNAIDNVDVGRIPLVISNPVLFESTKENVVYSYGDNLQVENESTGEWFNAVVTKSMMHVEDDNHNCYNVVYRDGMYEKNVPKRRLRILHMKSLARGELLDAENDIVSQEHTEDLDSDNYIKDVLEDSTMLLSGETTPIETEGAINEDVINTENVIIKDKDNDQFKSPITSHCREPISELITSAVDLMPTILGLAGIKNVGKPSHNFVIPSKCDRLVENVMNEMKSNAQLFEQRSDLEQSLYEVMGRDLSKILLLEESGNMLLERGNFAITVSLLDRFLQVSIKSKDSSLSVKYSMDDMSKEINTVEVDEGLSEILLRCRSLNIIPDLTCEKSVE
mmetsp:Transcript_19761/g.23968  ORF Transcript_19761/g.23968 Transcript_19761/m.23968 type:complete len:451 (-) Transcript_19761:261-1613(-)